MADDLLPRPLTQEEQDACEGILAGETPRHAFRRATGNVSVDSYRKFLASQQVGAYLSARRIEIRERTGFSDLQWLQEVSDIAFFDPLELALADIRTPKDIANLPAYLRKLIVGWKFDRNGNFELKLADKQRAQDMLAKNQGLYQKDRINDRDRVDLLTSAFWRFVIAKHVHDNMTIEEAQFEARRNPEAVKEWAVARGILPAPKGEIAQ